MWLPVANLRTTRQYRYAVKRATCCTFELGRRLAGICSRLNVTIWYTEIEYCACTYILNVHKTVCGCQFTERENFVRCIIYRIVLD